VTSEDGVIDSPTSVQIQGDYTATGQPAADAKIPAAGWYALAILTLISLFSYMDKQAVLILLEPIKVDLGLTNTQLGLLSGMAFAALYTILGLPLARLADRTSRVKLLSACFAVWSVMTAVCGFAQTFTQLFLARMGVGVGEAGCFPAAHSIIGDRFPGGRRALAIAILQSGAALGGSFGLFLIGYIGQHYGWRVALQVVGLAGAPMILLVMLTLPEPARPTSPHIAGERFHKALGGLLRRPAFLYLVIGYSLAMMGTNGVSTWTPTFLLRTFGLSLSAVGAWYGLASASGSILGLLTGGVLVGRLMRKDPRWELWICVVAYCIVLPLYAAMTLSPTWWMAISLQAASTYFSAMGAGAGLSAIQSFAEPRRRATAVAVLLFCSGLLGAGAGPYIIGVVTDLLIPRFGKDGLRYAMLMSQVMLAPGIFFFALSGLRSTKDRVA